MLDAALDPTLLVQAQHQACLVIKSLLITFEGQCGSERFWRGKLPEVPIVANKSVVSVAPEISLIARPKNQFT